MVVEILILGADKGLLYQIRDRLCWHKKAALFGEFVDQTPFARIDPTDRRGCILGKRFMAGQVAPIHVEDRADGQGRHGNAQREQRKDPAEK